MPAILDIWIYLFVNAMTTVSAVVFLYSPGHHAGVRRCSEHGRRRRHCPGSSDGNDDFLYQCTARVWFTLELATWTCEAHSGMAKPIGLTTRGRIMHEHSCQTRTPKQSEGEVNTSDRRMEWAARTHDRRNARGFSSRMRDFFSSTSLFRPRVFLPLQRRKGAWIEDLQGTALSRFPWQQRPSHRLWASETESKPSAEQMDELPFAPRRFACEPALQACRKAHVRYRTGRPGQRSCSQQADPMPSKSLSRSQEQPTGGTRWFRSGIHFTGRDFGAASVGGEQLFRSHIIGPLLTRHGTCCAVCLLSLSLWLSR